MSCIPLLFSYVCKLLRGCCLLVGVCDVVYDSANMSYYQYMHTRS